MIYRSVFYMKIGKNTVIYYGLESRCLWNIEIGNGSIIGDYCILDARNGIKIGENVNMIYKFDGKHRFFFMNSEEEKRIIYILR